VKNGLLLPLLLPAAAAIAALPARKLRTFSKKIAKPGPDFYESKKKDLEEV